MTLVRSFVAAAKGGGSSCEQMIMGGGKTTVITPLLAPYLPCISTVSPLYLAYISPGDHAAARAISPLYLHCISPISRLYLPR